MMLEKSVNKPFQLPGIIPLIYCLFPKMFSPKEAENISYASA